LIESLVSDQIPRKFGFSLDQIAVLTPSNRGPLGTLALNQRLQAKLNPPETLTQDEREHSIVTRSNTFRIGDRVCQRVNNYNLDIAGVFNGDTGIIIDLVPEESTLTVEMWDGRIINYPPSAVKQLSLAYSRTV